MTDLILEALEATIAGSYGSGFDRKEKSDERYQSEVILKAHTISDFLLNVDDGMSVMELRERLDEIWNTNI